MSKPLCLLCRIREQRYQVETAPKGDKGPRTLIGLCAPCFAKEMRKAKLPEVPNRRERRLLKKAGVVIEKVA
jgi:hypothetical protein